MKAQALILASCLAACNEQPQIVKTKDIPTGMREAVMSPVGCIYGTNNLGIVESASGPRCANLGIKVGDKPQ